MSRESHHYFCDQENANYFEHVGENIATILLQHRNLLQVWIA